MKFQTYLFALLLAFAGTFIACGESDNGITYSDAIGSVDEAEGSYSDVAQEQYELSPSRSRGSARMCKQWGGCEYVCTMSDGTRGMVSRPCKPRSCSCPAGPVGCVLRYQHCKWVTVPPRDTEEVESREETGR